MTELEAKLLEALKDGVFDGFRVDYPGGYSSKRKSVDKGVFIKDGKIFNELVRGNDSRKRFFDRIIEVVTLLGGDSTNVF